MADLDLNVIGLLRRRCFPNIPGSVPQSSQTESLGGFPTTPQTPLDTPGTLKIINGCEPSRTLDQMIARGSRPKTRVPIQKNPNGG